MKMLPDFRFIIGATLATSLLGMAAFGLFAATRLAHHAKIGPLEASRSFAFADQPERDSLYAATNATPFADLERRAATADAAGGVPPATAGNLPIPVTAERPDIAARTATATLTPATEAPAARPENYPANDLSPAIATFPASEPAQQAAASDAAETITATAPSSTQPAVSNAAPPPELALPPVEPRMQPVEPATAPTTALPNDTAETGAAAPSAAVEPSDTGSISAPLQPAAERVAAVPMAPAEIDAAQPEQPSVPAKVAPSALPKPAVTVRHAAPPARHAIAPETERTVTAPRSRVRPQPQQPYAGQQLTGFEWAGIRAKPQASESYATQPRSSQQYGASPMSQYRTQSYPAQQYARDPYVDNRWRPWSSLQAGRSYR
jgi:hypothetical protein